jgi:hypothetical protein
MKTDDLIAALAIDAAPPVTSPEQTALRFVGPILAGIAASLLIVWLWLGFQPMERALGSSNWWLKFGYAAVLGLIGLVLAGRAARPGMRGARSFLTAALIVGGLMAILGLIQVMEAPAHTRLTLLLGRSWTICAWLIVVVSAPIFAGAIVGMRSLAPTRPALAGAAAGLLAGGAGAAVYALHCPELAQSFVAVWYTMGIAACAGLGALLGPRLLRW